MENDSFYGLFYFSLAVAVMSGIVWLVSHVNTSFQHFGRMAMWIFIVSLSIFVILWIVDVILKYKANKKKSAEQNLNPRTRQPSFLKTE